MMLTRNAAVRQAATRARQQSPFQVAADLMWTHGTDGRAIFHNGATWIGSIKSNGWVSLYHFDHSTRVSTGYQLANFSQNDHHSPALLDLPDDRVAFHYQRHNADTHSFLRVTTNPNDPSAFDAAIQVPSAGLVGYAHTWCLSATGKYYVAYRVGIQSQYVNSASVSDLSTWDGERQWIVNGGNRPYPKFCSNGVDRVDIAFIQGHPNNVNASVYHCYMQLDGGVEKFYKTDGTYISTGSVTPSQATLVFNGSTENGEAWIWDVAIGADGHPRVLFVRYATTTDHRHMHGRWDAATGQWVIAEIGVSAPFANEALTDPGLCFDGNTTDIVYRGAGTGIPFEMQEWRTTVAGGDSFSKHRNITTGTSAPNFHSRPYSPRGHDGTVACVWLYGTIQADDLTEWSMVGLGIGSA